MNQTSCLRISNFFRKKNCYSRISINQNNIYSDKDILKKNDKFYIYIEGEKSLKAKIIKEYKSNKNIQNNYIKFNENTENNNDIENEIKFNENTKNNDIENETECNENTENNDNDLENDIEEEYKNKIINIPENILSLFVFLFLYLSMNSYMLGVQLRKKIYNIINK